jgi:hypothetical protein
MIVLAASGAHRGVVWGIILICVGLLHLAFRRYYARRNAAVESARRETAIAPFRRHWFGLTSERGNLIYGTVASAVMIVGGIIVLVLSL